MTSPNVTSYRNGEFLRYMKDVLELVNKQDVTTLLLTTQRDDLATIVTCMDAVLHQSSKSTILNQEIIELEERREKAYTRFRVMLNGFNHHADETQKLHAETEMNVLKKYDNEMNGKSSEEKTDLVTGLVNSFERKTALVTTLGDLVIGWLTELKEANKAFVAKYFERIGEAVVNPVTDMMELRIQAIAAYKVLISNIEAYKALRNNEAYVLLESEINVLTKQYNLIVRNRIARG